LTEKKGGEYSPAWQSERAGETRHGNEGSFARLNDTSAALAFFGTLSIQLYEYRATY
jgi:hypothetical protein